jgi:hypothetical protein
MTAPATTSDLSYPIGKWQYTPHMSCEHRAALIQQIAEAPGQMRAAIKGLSPEQLDTPYRPDGWTVRQVVHHVPESHMNAYIRFKWALTEDSPAIKAYDENAWSNTPEVNATPVDCSLAILAGLHERWVILLNSLSDKDWQRTIEHPQNGTMSLEKLLAIYAWHGRHHAAHITELRKRSGW